MSSLLDSNTLQDKTALITGGGSGLGLAMAKKFGTLGARVVLCGRDRGRLERAAAEVDGTGENVYAHPADVRDFDQVELMVQAATERFGAIDILVNNAAGNFLAATEDLSPGGFDAIVRVVL